MEYPNQISDIHLIIKFDVVYRNRRLIAVFT
jgi:hypothetical protein